MIALTVPDSNFSCSTLSLSLECTGILFLSLKAVPSEVVSSEAKGKKGPAEGSSARFKGTRGGGLVGGFNLLSNKALLAALDDAL